MRLEYLIQPRTITKGKLEPPQKLMDRDVIVLKADNKRNAVILMERGSYEDKMKDLL